MHQDGVAPQVYGSGLGKQRYGTDSTMLVLSIVVAVNIVLLKCVIREVSDPTAPTPCVFT